MRRRRRALSRATRSTQTRATQGFYFPNPMVTIAVGGDASAITAATPDGAEVTRNEATAAMADLPRKPRKKETESSYSNSFNDVPATHWAANHIGYMEQLGLIGGYEDGSFRPNTPVSRAEVASVVCRGERCRDLDRLEVRAEKWNREIKKGDGNVLLF